MKLLKMMLITLVLCGVSVLSPSCTSKPASTPAGQVVTVQRGDISVSITGVGNLALSNKVDLAFDIPSAFKVSSSNPISVQEVLVEEGDSVQEGQVLVKLDTTAWDKQVNELEKALTTAKRNLTSKESALAKAERQVTAKELAASQAQYSVQAAENDLKKKDAVKAAFDAVDTLTFDLRVALAAEKDSSDLRKALASVKEDLKTTLQKYSSTVDSSDDAALEAAKSLLQLQQDKMDLEDAQIAVQDAHTAVADAQLDKEDAEVVVKDAQTDLDEAKSLSPIIKAPFSGFITKVNVKGGDQILKGAVAMQIADPNQFEANILVTENDILSIKVGGEATVSLDALSDLTFPAKITKIAPTATVSSGVVNYKVTVELTSLQPITASQNILNQPPSQSANVTTPSITPPTGGTPPGTPPAMPSQGATGTVQPPTATTGATSSETSSNSSSSQTITLKDGLSATVNVVIQKKDNILIIPSKAITRQGQNSTVQVVKDTTTETRIVKTGMTDGTYTEITEGLSEGEQVVYKLSSSTSSSSSTTRSNQQIGIPGVSGGPPGGF